MAEIKTLGSVGINPLGEYNSQTEYEKLDVVLYQGSSYVALKPVQGIVPTNEEYWQKLVSGGVGVDDIVDNLDSTDSEKPLSANMGRELKESVYKLIGKKINFMGDSITKGVNGSRDTYLVDNPFPKVIEKNYGCVCNNYGVSGSSLGGDGTTISEITQKEIGFMPMNDRIKNMDKNVDYNVIMGGTNDKVIENAVPLGVISDTNVTTFYGSLKNICEYLCVNYASTKNVLITPPQNTNQNIQNAFGNTLEDYVKAIKEVGSMYGIPVLDLYSNIGGSPVITEWKNANMPDGLHPNQKLYDEMAHKIAVFLQKL